MIKYLALASPISDENALNPILRGFEEKLGLKELKIVKDEDEARAESEGNHVLAFVATGGTERLIVSVRETSASSAFVYHDSYNSLPALLEASAYVGLNSFSEDDEEGIKAYLKAVQVSEELRSEKLLFIGEPSPWLVYSGDKKSAEALFGKAETVDLGVLESYAVKESPDGYEEVMRRAEALGPSEDDFKTSLKIEKAIRRILVEKKARVFTIRCFDLISSLHGTACLALSRLNDEGYVAACEGDVNASATMFVLSRISGLPTFMGNVTKVLGNRILIAHCTSPTKILGSFKYMSHFESGLGVGIAGTFEEGVNVTFARLDLKKRVLRAGVGKVVKQPFREDICRTQVLVESEGNPESIVKSSIGNHYALTLGNHLRTLEQLAKVLKFSFEKA